MVLESILPLLAQHWLALITAFLAAHLLRNYFYHGLHKYPGPLPGALSNLWRFIDVYGRRPEATHIRLHEQHGDVVRLGPNYLSFADPAALRDIYGPSKGFTKSEFYPVQQSVSAGHALPSLFSSTSESFHAALRRAVSSAFSMSSLTQYEPLVDTTTRVFLSQTAALYAAPRATCDFARWLQFYAFDVIGNLTYSSPHGFLSRNEDVDGITAALAKLFDYVAPVGQLPWLDSLLLKNPLYLLASRFGLVNSTSSVAKFAAGHLSNRLASPAGAAPTNPPDLLSKFLAARTTHPETINDRVVLTLAVSMAFAGSDTTAISLSSIFYHLLRHPRVLARLRAELDSATFSDPQLVSWAESQRLPYLAAVISESFRLHPAAGLPLERIVPPGGATITGRFVPGGTIVGCSAWVIHRRKEVFGEDVEVFRPERWMPEGGRTEAQRREMGACMFQFGMGARTCIGKNISLMEIYKVVPAVLRGFEVELVGGEWRTWNAWFVRQLGFEVRFRRREKGEGGEEKGMEGEGKGVDEVYVES